MTQLEPGKGLSLNEEALRKLEQDLSGYTGRLLRENFGKGPESVFVSLGYTFVTIYLRNFLTPAERVLLEQDQIMTILNLRLKLMQSLEAEFKANFEVITGKKLREVYYDWNLHNKSGMIVGITSEPLTPIEKINDEFDGRGALDHEIMSISSQAQKLPEEIYSCQLNSRTIVNIRNGILVRIEKELVRLGKGSLLKNVKRNLEKGFLHNDSNFESLLDQRVIDIFVDWDFELDKSVILFITNPKPPREQSFSKQTDVAFNK